MTVCHIGALLYPPTLFFLLWLPTLILWLPITYILKIHNKKEIFAINNSKKLKLIIQTKEEHLRGKRTSPSLSVEMKGKRKQSTITPQPLQQQWGGMSVPVLPSSFALHRCVNGLIPKCIRLRQSIFLTVSSALQKRVKKSDLAWWKQGR